MQVKNTQKTAFGTKFVIAPHVKPKNQRFHYSDITKKEIQLSKDLEKLTPLDKSYKLVLSSIDYLNNKFNFKLLKYKKEVADTPIDFSTKTPLDELDGKKLQGIFDDLKIDSEGNRVAYTRRVQPQKDEYQVFVNKKLSQSEKKMMNINF